MSLPRIDEHQERFFDVDDIGVHHVQNGDPEIAGTWQLFEFHEEVDYRAPRLRQVIWSIGRSADGRIYAATDSRFYQNPRFTCLWLR